MNRLSLFKFSRHFFALFLVVTVLPLVSLLLWSNYGLEQSLLTRQKQFLEMDTRRIHEVFRQELAMDADTILETAQSVSRKALSLSEYKGIFNADEAWWLDSPEAKTFFRQYPGATTNLARISEGRHQQAISGDYFPSGHAIQSYFIVPLSNAHQGLLLVKSVPAETFAPNGPYRVSIYAGGEEKPSALIFKSDFMWHRPQLNHSPMPSPGLNPPTYPGLSTLPSLGAGARMDQRRLDHQPDMLTHPDPFMNEKGKAFGPERHHHRHHPPGAGFGPPASWRDPHYDPNKSKVMASRTVQLNSQAGLPIALIDIKALAPPHPRGSEFSRNNQWIGLLILVTGILTSLLAGNYIRKNFIEPLTQLALVASRVQEGDLGSRVETDTIKQSDVRQTLEKFNAMLSGLAEKDRLRNSFISNLTHDFRTPLLAQRRSLELLSQEMNQLELKQQEKLALGLLKNSEHLLTMVNQLLETYQTEAGSFMLKLNLESVPTLVNQCFEQLAPLAEERQIVLTLEFSDDFPELMVDADYLKRVFINLLGNAIENIPKRSRIEVTGKVSQPGWVQIHVKDNGLGISPQERQQLFERYYAGTNDTRKLGSGLGLYICTVLIAAHQGNISVDSVEGSYTDFMIELPITRPQGAS